MSKSKLWLLAALAVVSAAGVQRAAAQSYPERPITPVVAFAPGGTEVTPSTPEEYTAFNDKDEIKGSGIVKASGAKSE